MKHTKMTNLTLFLRGCYLLSLLRPILPSVGGFAISCDGCFYHNTTVPLLIVIYIVTNLVVYSKGLKPLWIVGHSDSATVYMSL